MTLSAAFTKRVSAAALVAALGTPLIGASVAYAGAYNPDLLDWTKDNIISYDSSKNAWNGTAGKDFLIGSSDSGSTTVRGKGGDDVFVLAQQLVETIIGGDGADVFVLGYDASDGMYTDVIVDFDPAEGDRIDLSMVDSTGKVPGKQPYRYIGEKSEFEGSTTYPTGLLRFWDGYLIGTSNSSCSSDPSDIIDCEVVLKLNGVEHLDESALILKDSQANLERKKKAIKKAKKKINKMHSKRNKRR